MMLLINMYYWDTKICTIKHSLHCIKHRNSHCYHIFLYKTIEIYGKSVILIYAYLIYHRGRVR